MFDAALLQEPEEKATVLYAKSVQRRTDIRDPKSYVMKIQSIQGQDGSAALVRAVAVLRDCGWNSEEAFRFLCEVWSPQQQPPWSAQEISRCVTRLFKEQR